MRRIDNTAVRAAFALLPLAALSAISLLVTDSIDEVTVASTLAPTTTVKATTTTAAPAIEVTSAAAPTASLFDTDVDLADAVGCFDVGGISIDAPYVKNVECDVPHRYQVFATVELPLVSEYDQDDVSAAAENACAAEFQPFVGTPETLSKFTFGFTIPVYANWPAVRISKCFLFLDGEWLHTGDASNSDY